MTYFLLMFASNNAMSDDERVFLFVFHQRKREYICVNRIVFIMWHKISAFLSSFFPAALFS